MERSARPHLLNQIVLLSIKVMLPTFFKIYIFVSGFDYIFTKQKHKKSDFQYQKIFCILFHQKNKPRTFQFPCSTTLAEIFFTK